MSDSVDLWLDDMRPAPDGWVHVKTVAEAQRIFKKHHIRRASLDHDLGACKSCWPGTPEEWLEQNNYRSMPNCRHFGTGLTLVGWMVETSNWPKEKPVVHSANQEGREAMLVLIDRHFPA